LPAPRGQSDDRPAGKLLTSTINQNFLPRESFPAVCTDVDGEEAAALFFLFLSAFGFFFSRELRICPFATLTSLLLR
jgi:hypothetical protein